jgi:hypothetical protein
LSKTDSSDVDEVEETTTLKLRHIKRKTEGRSESEESEGELNEKENKLQPQSLSSSL